MYPVFTNRLLLARTLRKSGARRPEDPVMIETIDELEVLVNYQGRWLDNRVEFEQHCRYSITTCDC